MLSVLRNLHTCNGDVQKDVELVNDHSYFSQSFLHFPISIYNGLKEEQKGERENKESMHEIQLNYGDNNEKPKMEGHSTLRLLGTKTK
jgi:hypothetical protein